MTRGLPSSSPLLRADTFSARTGGTCCGDWGRVRLPVDVAGLVQQWQALGDPEEWLDDALPYVNEEREACAIALLRALARISARRQTNATLLRLDHDREHAGAR